MEKIASLNEFNQVNGISTISLSNKIFIGETPLTKAKVFINPNGNAGNFLCSHVMRIITDFKVNNLDLISGFIHIPQSPDFFQLSEVLSILLNDLLSKSISNEINILFTGFTKFGKVENNSSSDFLFGDGISDNKESFGLKKPSKKNIDKIIHFLKSKHAISNFSIKESILTFNIENKCINMFFLRLPVDDSFSKNSLDKDYAGHFLYKHFKEIKPNAIISLGVGIYDKTDEYNVEINAEGMYKVNYFTKKFIPNYDFSLVYENYFKEKICQQ